MTFISVDTQPFASSGILYHQQTTINTILLYIRDNKILITEDTSSVRCKVDLRLYGIPKCIKDNEVKQYIQYAIYFSGLLEGRAKILSNSDMYKTQRNKTVIIRT